LGSANKKKNREGKKRQKHFCHFALFAFIASLSTSRIGLKIALEVVLLSNGQGWMQNWWLKKLDQSNANGMLLECGQRRERKASREVDCQACAGHAVLASFATFPAAPIRTSRTLSAPAQPFFAYLLARATYAVKIIIAYLQHFGFFFIAHLIKEIALIKFDRAFARQGLQRVVELLSIQLLRQFPP
jgi:hypothetical protein